MFFLKIFWGFCKHCFLGCCCKVQHNMQHQSNYNKKVLKTITVTEKSVFLNGFTIQSSLFQTFLCGLVWEGAQTNPQTSILLINEKIMHTSHRRIHFNNIFRLHLKIRVSPPSNHLSKDVSSQNSATCLWPKNIKK